LRYFFIRNDASAYVRPGVALHLEGCPLPSSRLGSSALCASIFLGYLVRTLWAKVLSLGKDTPPDQSSGRHWEHILCVIKRKADYENIHYFYVTSWHIQDQARMLARYLPLKRYPIRPIKCQALRIYSMFDWTSVRRWMYSSSCVTSWCMQD